MSNDPWQQKLRGRNFQGVKSFDDMGQIIYQDLSQGVIIRKGQIFECPTVKGGKNLIVTLAVKDGHLLYAHADKGRKTPIDAFIKAVLHGDIELKRASEIDTERLSMATIGMDAIANRRSGEEQIEFYGEGAAERFRTQGG